MTSFLIQQRWRKKAANQKHKDRKQEKNALAAYLKICF